jgi:hypothetical protein
MYYLYLLTHLPEFEALCQCRKLPYYGINNDNCKDEDWDKGNPETRAGAREDASGLGTCVFYYLFSTILLVMSFTVRVLHG